MSYIYVELAWPLIGREIATACREQVGNQRHFNMY
jgi:hypothetical protein